MAAQDTIRIEYVRLEQAARWDWGANPKRHDLDGLVASLRKYGFQDPPKFDPTLNEGQGGFVKGNGRTKALLKMQAAGEQPPPGIALTPDGEWAMPVYFGNALPDQATAEAFALDHNNLNLGPQFDALDAARLYDPDYYADLLARLGEQAALPVTVGDEDLAAILANLAEPEPDADDCAPAEAEPETDELDPDPEPAENEPEAGTVANIGRWQFKLSRAEYFALIEDIRQTAGFDNESIHAEIARRLGVTTPGEPAEEEDGGDTGEES